MERKVYTKNSEVSELLRKHYGRAPRVYVRSFGCQQSVNDGEKLKGVLQDLGCELLNDAADADMVFFNTCAVREHAEQRVFGNIGALKAMKEARAGVLICLCGCMGQQKGVVEKLKESYPYVDMVLGVDAAGELAGALLTKFSTRRRALKVPPEPTGICECVPIVRENPIRAFLPIMYGCDNFCSYCIVPYVRGRERSRRFEDIRRELEDLVAAGYKEITLLGQNVNSYGKGLDEGLDFSDLCAKLDEVPGEYTLRFVTSHPKDATRKMIDTIAASEHIAKHLHLPVQSGSNTVLSRMNRRYTVEDYLSLIRYARQVCPELTFSSDIMLGFPDESEQDFEDTLALVKEVGFTQLFTFIYSRRDGTEAAGLPDALSHKEKTGRMARLLAVQEEVAAELSKQWVGGVFRALVEGPARDDTHMAARLDNNMLCEFAGDKALAGQFVNVKVTDFRGAVLRGELA